MSIEEETSLTIWRQKSCDTSFRKCASILTYPLCGFKKRFENRICFYFNDSYCLEILNYPLKYGYNLYPQIENIYNHRAKYSY